MTIRSFLMILILLGFMTSCSSLSRGGEDQRLWDFFAEEWEWGLQEYPTWATFEGRRDLNHLWNDMSFEAIERRDQRTHEVLKRLESFNRSRLSEENQIFYDIYLESTKRSIEGQAFPGHVLVMNQLRGPQSFIPMIFRVMPKDNMEDFKAIFSRLEKLPEVFEQYKALMEKGMELGVTPPRKTLRDVPKQLESFLSEDFDSHPIMTNFNSIPSSFTPEQQQALRLQLEDYQRTVVIPVFRDFHQFFKESYLPNTREEIAMSTLPNGEAWYNYAIRGHTTTDLSYEEIHQIGLSEVQRIRQEMRDLVEGIGFSGGLNNYVDYLHHDKKYKFSSAEEMLKEYRAFAKEVDTKIPQLFKMMPRTPFGIEAIPAHIAESSPAAYYQGGNIDTGRAGLFYLNTANLENRPRWEMKALTLHEAVPGHHFQIALAQEMEDVPEFRKRGGFTAYVEGWALYAEALGVEMELYQSPASHFGRLSYEMWRAIRLVVDTGIHAKGWTRDQALEFFKQYSGRSDSEAIVEVDRYIVWPGQALAYKIGELKIWELRRMAEARLGDKFDLREFHHEILRHGALPLSLLEKMVEKWVEEASRRTI